MNKVIALFAFITISTAAHAEPKLTALWQSDATLKVPESVYFDAQRKILFESNIDGAPWEMDGKGSIGKVGLDGKVIAVDWVSGLNAPKGIGIHGNTLYVADVDALVAIDIKAGKIIARIPVADAEQLNDVSAASDGSVYFTDSKKGIIHKLEKNKVSTVLDGLTSLNGVLADKGQLYFVADGALYQLGKDGKAEKIAGGMEGGVDGVERVSDDAWLVSCWPGVLYYVTRDGNTVKLLDTRDNKINSADIGYDSATMTVYVPTFFKNSVMAYKLDL